MRTLTIIGLFFLNFNLYSQTKLDMDVKFDFYRTYNCNYYVGIKGESFSFPPNKEVVNIIDLFLEKVELHKNFKINAVSLPNAIAVIQDSTRYILINRHLISQINGSTDEKWKALIILSHQIGHHLSNHNLINSERRPIMELKADEFSGFVLYKIGATLNEVQSVLAAIGSHSGSSTHPEKNARLEATAVGWNKAKESDSNTNSVKIKDYTNTPPVIPSDTSNNIQYISLCIFNEDPFRYYVTTSNVIIKFNPATNQSSIIGQKQLSLSPLFTWLYVTSSLKYGVDRNGKIWSQNDSEQPIQVGYVTKI